MSVTSPVWAIEPPREHLYTVILLHGFGETGEIWEEFGEYMHRFPSMQSTKFMCPTAAVRTVTLWEKEGRDINAWFDIPSWNDIVRNHNDEEGMFEARDCVDKLIDFEIDKGIPAQNIIVGGFSQGGCLALILGLTSHHSHSLAGVFALSAYLPAMERFTELVQDQGHSEARTKDISIFIGHGNGDPRVKWNWGDRTQKALKEMGFKEVEFNTYRGVFHHMCIKEVEDLRSWFERKQARSEIGVSGRGATHETLSL